MKVASKNVVYLTENDVQIITPVQLNALHKNVVCLGLVIFVLELHASVKCDFLFLPEKGLSLLIALV